MAIVPTSTPRYTFSRLAVVLALLLASLVVTGRPAEAASTCNGAVCSEVTVSGGAMTRWKTTAYVGSGYECVTARFWVNAGLWRQQTVCGSANTLVANIYGTYDFPSGSSLCASWVGVSGYACLNYY